MDDSASIGPSRIKKCCKHMLTMGHLTETLTRKAQRDQSEIRKWVAKKRDSPGMLNLWVCQSPLAPMP